MNKLLAPGQLIEGHKDLEQADCLSCHAAGKGVPDQKCLDCHKDIRQSMARPKSFHKLTDQPCFSCHSDHKGRDFDAIAFDITDFDHADTGFPLAPKHQDIKCLDCHTAKRSDRAAQRRDKATSSAGDDPDLAGMVAGPQPSPGEADEGDKETDPA